MNQKSRYYDLKTFERLEQNTKKKSYIDDIYEIIYNYNETIESYDKKEALSDIDRLYYLEEHIITYQDICKKWAFLGADKDLKIYNFSEKEEKQIDSLCSSFLRETVFKNIPENIILDEIQKRKQNIKVKLEGDDDISKIEAIADNLTLIEKYGQNHFIEKDFSAIISDRENEKSSIEKDIEEEFSENQEFFDDYILEKNLEIKNRNKGLCY